MSRGGYIKIERGENQLTTATIARAAKVFGVHEAEIFATPASAKVMGKIGAGAEIQPDFEQVGPDGLYEINSDIPLAPGMIGFEVEGDSMWPRYDPGDIIICSAEGIAPEALPSGAEAAVKTEDGRRFLKRVRRVGGEFVLESHNAPPIERQRLVWASEVATVIRARQWRRLNGR